MESQKQQVVDRIKQANNILVTVSSNPSVDQLASCIGVTLALNKLGKHATAVFSGNVPSTIEFLQPEKTIEKNTDSLRDFIIALDKSKADKLRYKVEDKVVKIFITPYRTSISDKDLDFSQGDFNVDVVLALGVHNQADLDQAITAHGRILHDATVISVNAKPGGGLGSILWVDTSASSLSELGAQLIDALDKKLIDEQIATALLTGIVAETDRFSNAKTAPATMSISAELMAAGANQQLVATKLQEPPKPVQPPTEITAQPNVPAPPTQSAAPEAGTLEIDHGEKKAISETPPAPAPDLIGEEGPGAPQIHIDEAGALHNVEDEQKAPATETSSEASAEPGQRMILKPPTMASPLTANTLPDDFSANVTNDPLSLPAVGPLLERDDGLPPADQPDERQFGKRIAPPDETEKESKKKKRSKEADKAEDQPIEPGPSQNAPADQSPSPNETVAQMEQAIGSPHAQAGADTVQPQPDLSADAARQAAMQAIDSSQQPLTPRYDLNAMPMDVPNQNVAAPAPTNPASAAAPPPVPPPMLPPTYPPQ